MHPRITHPYAPNEPTYGKMEPQPVLLLDENKQISKLNKKSHVENNELNTRDKSNI